MDSNNVFLTFFQLLTAIFLEAAPFLLLGSLLAALIEEFTDEELFRRFLPKSRFFAVLTGLFAGLLLPTCECGVVPVVRKLLGKRVPPAVAVAYLFAAPSINPIVILSTYIAFEGDLKMVTGRLLIATTTALALGWLLGNITPGQLLRDPGIQEGSEQCCRHHHGHSATGWLRKLSAIAAHTSAEFLDMSRFLLLGAVVTALFKVTAPVSLLDWFFGNVILSVIMMMALAIVLSVCSEADAFIAASFSAFPPVSLLAFMGIGPMVDLKLIAMYGAVFKKRVVVDFVLVPILIVFGLCLVLADWFGM